MNEEFAEVLTTAEADGIEIIEEVLREAKFVDAKRERCVKAGNTACWRDIPIQRL